MQLILVGIVAFGIVNGNPKAIVNGGLALAITFLPAVLERNYRLPLDPWLALWVTAAVFFHTLGSAGLYGHFHWWDHFTHALSASLVAGIGYVTVRALDLHSDRIELPDRFYFFGSCLTERNNDQISDIVTGWRARWKARMQHRYRTRIF